MDTLRLVLPPGVRGDRGICRLDVFGLLGLAMGLGTLADMAMGGDGRHDMKGSQGVAR